MRKIGLTLLTAFVGGAMAIGAYKVMETKYTDNLSFEDRQKVYFASNPLTSNITSSAGEVDFTQAAAAVTPAVVYIRTTYAATSGNSDMDDFFGQMFGQRYRRQPQEEGGQYDDRDRKSQPSRLPIETQETLAEGQPVADGLFQFRPTCAREEKTDIDGRGHAG